MKNKKKIQKLIKSSKAVISDCALENGAIVAANTDKSYYPREAGNYRYVWPRDASFICLAGKYLNLSLAEKFLVWLYKKPEDFKKEKLLYANYSTNGRIASLGSQFEPDQMGIVLWLIHFLYKDNLNNALKHQALIKRLAEGLCQAWNKTYFLPNTLDLWEDGFRKTSSVMENNFTYSLAACARGLLCAHEIIPNKNWEKTAKQMISEIEEAYSKEFGYFLRNCGRICDKNIDASLVGLVWPFEIISPKDERIIKTIKKIEQNIVVSGGVHRFQFDYFDSEGTAWEGGGAWPVLNFWLAIYWHLAGHKKKAESYYQWVIERVDKYIPEQIFQDFRQGISPLAWSHAMFIIASHYLGYLK
ncbi:MAG: glycoside hydrolase family 15 protein [Patescibacteria group bacterium]|nr:glycoside hydrolase family 15 protein [Patescibacteria group bacterium]